MIFAKIAVSVLGLSGFILSNHIRKSKKKSTPLVCPLNGECETVIFSRFSKLFGIPLEFIGMSYYGLIAVSYFIYSFFPQTLPAYASFIILGVTATAFCFSIYLTALQAVVIKSWCTWCLFSAGICTALFILVMFVSEISAKDLLNYIPSIF